jgi:hypothetical protein
MSYTNAMAIDGVFASLIPAERRMVNLFLDALNRQNSSHEDELEPDYAKEISIYLHEKAAAESKGEPFEQDFGLEAHIAGCESCQHFYKVVKQTLPVLDRFKGVVK